MKSFLKAAALAAVLCQQAAAQSPIAALATQTFFIPMPEDYLFNHTFWAINTDRLGPIDTMIGISISTDNTRLYWDHWEDGYEPDATKPTRSTTQVWGDGDPSNGCVPNKPCTAAGDVLRAGDVIILDNDIPMPRNKANIFYDGGDRLQASYPVTVTRAAFPKGNPGSLMAGAIEVFDTTQLGNSFIAPAGQDSTALISSTPFEYAVFYVMAVEDGTVVTRPDGTTKTLSMGETILVENLMTNQKISSSKNVAVDFITGDRMSTYELRWYAMVDSDNWETSYLAPVGDSIAQTRLVVFNPSTSSLTVTYSYLSSGTKVTKTVSVSGGKNAVTDVIPSGSACSLSAPGKFIALSVHDTVSTGQIYDWGYPVMPMSWLTNQAVVGLGYGCTNNNCGTGTPRNVVFVSPVEDAWVHVDYNNDGVIDNSTFCKVLTSTIFMDKNDKDLSGARFFATKNSSITGPPVSLAAAWGQNAAFSYSGDNQALDLGTVILPFKSLRVTKSASLVEDKDMNGAVSPGDTLEYVIQVVNTGPTLDIPAGGLTILDDGMPSGVTYIPGTFKCTDSNAGVLATSDDASGTPFPLDGVGYKNPGTLTRRGGTQDYKFRVTVNDNVAAGTNLVNSGKLQQTGNPDLPFSVTTPVVAKLVWVPTTLIPPTTPTGSCMSDSYKYYGKTGTLSCTSKTISLDSVTSSTAKQCEVGKTVKLNLTATVRFAGGTLYDPGWYIARDGGDALTGACSTGFLEQKYASAISIIEGSGGGCHSYSKGSVFWNNDKSGGNDECGDVTVDSSGGAISYNILVDTELKCKDSDNDGKLDFSICFSWRDSANDSVCAVTSKLASGIVPQLFPGTTGSCYCAQYDVPNVVVLNPGGKVYPCA